MVGVYQLSDDLKLVIRNYYDGTMHMAWERSGDFGSASGVSVAGNTITGILFLPEKVTVTITAEGDGYTGTMESDKGTTALAGRIRPITPADDRTEKMTAKKRAMIMYATITKNTEKIALAFRESFEHYGWAVDFIRITNKERAPGNFADYDVVCLGSPIIAGSPMMCVTRQFSPGGGTDLEKNVAKNAEAGLGFNDGGVGLKGGPQGGPGGPEGPGGPGGPGGPNGETGGQAHYAGGPAAHGVYQPLGIVFTTYGGGFYGSNEALATVELLKLYLELKSVRVIGKFACCGREYGPAGIEDGGKPMLMGGTIDPPVYYQDADGKYHAGSFFFHTHMNSKPCERDIMKAKAMVMDIVEDYFLSHDGIRKDTGSCYTTIS